MEYEQIKKIIEDMSNSKLSSIDIEFPEGTKISMKKDINIQNIVVENKEPSKTEEIKANEETVHHADFQCTLCNFVERSKQTCPMDLRIERNFTRSV